MVLFGLHELMLRGNTVEDRVAHAAGLGADCVELFGHSIRENPVHTERALARHNLALSCVCGGYRGAVLHPNAEQRRHAHDDLNVLFELANQLGAVGVEVALLKQPPLGPSEQFPDLSPWLSQQELIRRFAIEVLSELAATAAAHNTRLVIEPQIRYLAVFPTSLSETLELCETVGDDRIGAMADVFHMNVEDRDLTGLLRESASVLLNVHVKDSNGGLPGEGHLDLEAMLAALADGGYQHAITLECRTEPGDEEVMRALAQLRSGWHAALPENPGHESPA